MTANVTPIRKPTTNAAGRPPRANLELEADLLSQLLSRAEVFDQISEITKPEHFWSDANRLVWETAVELAGVGIECSEVNVRNMMHARDRLRVVDGPEGLRRLVSQRPFVLHVERLALELRDIWRVRDLGIRAARIAAECHGDVGPIQEFLERAEAEVGELARVDDAKSSVTVLDSIKGVMAKIQNDGGTPGAVSTGLQCLDRFTLGLHPGELTLVAGRPGMGKSALMMQMATSIAGPNPKDAVLVFSLEMLHEQITTRTLCSLARVDSKDLRSNSVTDVGWRYLTEAATSLGRMPIHFDDTKMPSPLQIRSRCRRMRAKLGKEGKRLAAVFIDYVQLVDGRPMVSQRASREECVAACSRAFKALAMDLNVPVIAGAQLNRPLKGRVDRPSLTDLRESGSLEQDADNVVFIHRPEYYLGDRTPPDQKGVAELIVSKQRNGDTGIAWAKFFPRYTLFADQDWGAA